MLAHRMVCYLRLSGFQCRHMFIGCVGQVSQPSRDVLSLSDALSTFDSQGVAFSSQCSIVKAQTDVGGLEVSHQSVRRGDAAHPEGWRHVGLTEWRHHLLQQAVPREALLGFSWGKCEMNALILRKRGAPPHR